MIHVYTFSTQSQFILKLHVNISYNQGQSPCTKSPENHLHELQKLSHEQFLNQIQIKQIYQTLNISPLQSMLTHSMKMYLQTSLTNMLKVKRDKPEKKPLPCMNNELCMANTCYIHNTRRNEIQKHGRNSENSVIQKQNLRRNP